MHINGVKNKRCDMVASLKNANADVAKPKETKKAQIESTRDS